MFFQIPVHPDHSFYFQILRKSRKDWTKLDCHGCTELDFIRDLYLADFRLSQSAVQSVIQHHLNVSEIHLRFVLLRKKAVTCEVNVGVILSRSINTRNDQRLAVRRQQHGTWKTQRSWREDRSRDLDFVSSGGFYFDREEEEQHTGPAGF